MSEKLYGLIKKSKYVHLATCSLDHIPSIALMNYTYLPGHKCFGDQIDNRDYIIFSALDTSATYSNISTNSQVRLLFHDWITAKNLSLRKTSISNVDIPMEAYSQPSQENEVPSILEKNSERFVSLLDDLSQNELNSISASVLGNARVIAEDSQESNYYKRMLYLANPDADVYIYSTNAIVIKVQIELAKVTDADNNRTILDFQPQL